MITPLSLHFRRRAFTLIELLVVITIIGILVAIALPVFNTVQRKQYQVTSMSNLRQWGGAMVAAVGDNNNLLPWEGQSSAPVITDGTAWFNVLPPYMSEKPLSARLVSQMPQAGQKSVWVNPAVPLSSNATYKPYLFCYGMNYFLSNAQFRQMPITQIGHPSACVFMAETGDNFANCNPADVQAFFGSENVLTGKDNGANFLFCDGHVALYPRRLFDPTYNSRVLLGQGSAVEPDTSFTFVPYPGASH